MLARNSPFSRAASSALSLAMVSSEVLSATFDARSSRCLRSWASFDWMWESMALKQSMSRPTLVFGFLDRIAQVESTFLVNAAGYRLQTMERFRSRAASGATRQSPRAFRRAGAPARRWVGSRRCLPYSRQAGAHSKAPQAPIPLTHVTVQNNAVTAGPIFPVRIAVSREYGSVGAVQHGLADARLSSRNAPSKLICRDLVSNIKAAVVLAATTWATEEISLTSAARLKRN